MRLGEICALKWEEMDLDAGTVFVHQSLQHTKREGLRFKSTKNEGSRRIRLPSGAISELQRHKAEQARRRLVLGEFWRDPGWVWPKDDGTPRNPALASKTFHDFIRRTDLPPIRFHDLRHTHATLLGEAKVSSKVVQERLRHKTHAITMELYTKLFDWGTHWFDMLHFFNEEQRATWVMGQIDVSERRAVFGVPVETSGISHVAFENDVWGLLITGRAPRTPRLGKLVEREGMVIHGTEGRLEVAVTGGVRLRLRRFGGPDETPTLPQAADATVLSVLNLLECLESGAEPELSSRRALAATELIFATYESSRRRARVDLPLTIDDSPLLTGLEQGMWQPAEPPPARG